MMLNFFIGFKKMEVRLLMVILMQGYMQFIEVVLINHKLLQMMKKSMEQELY